jgi:predicted  nucleic acid-binding Zn-ribbon protein
MQRAPVRELTGPTAECFLSSFCGVLRSLDSPAGQGIIPEASTWKGKADLMARVLDGLLELHRIDQELLEVQRETERLPADLADTEQELGALEEQKSQILDDAQSQQVAGDKANVEIKELETKIEKYQVQLNIAKTQKEYDTLKKEIAAAQEQISELETAALTAYEQADELTAKVRGLTPQAEDARKRLEAARAQLDDRLADLAHRREKLERQRAEQAKTIDEDDLKVYEQVLSKHTDGAMVRVHDGCCMLCNINLTPQSYNLVLIGEQIQRCRSCGRICYSEDAPGGS